MIRLTEEGVLWRDFFFANNNGYFIPDYDVFETRVSLIADAKENLMEQILSDNPNNELIRAYKEEIEFQKENLSETMDEFIKYCKKNGSNASDKKELFEDIVNNDFSSGLWKILEDWKPITKYINTVTEKLEELHENIPDLKDDLSKLMMDSMRDNETRKILTEKLHLR